LHEFFYLSQSIHSVNGQQTTFVIYILGASATLCNHGLRDKVSQWLAQQSAHSQGQIGH